MIRGTIWGREIEMQGSPLTYLHYKREFGGDKFTVIALFISIGDLSNNTTFLSTVSEATFDILCQIL